MKKALKKLIINKEGDISFTKLGGWIVAVAGGVLTAGVCPPALIPYAKLVLAVGAGVGVAGARDTVKKQ